MPGGGCGPPAWVCGACRALRGHPPSSADIMPPPPHYITPAPQAVFISTNPRTRSHSLARPSHSQPSAWTPARRIPLLRRSLVGCGLLHRCCLQPLPPPPRPAAPATPCTRARLSLWAVWRGVGWRGGVAGCCARVRPRRDLSASLMTSAGQHGGMQRRQGRRAAATRHASCHHNVLVGGDWWRPLRLPGLCTRSHAWR